MVAYVGVIKEQHSRFMFFTKEGCSLCFQLFQLKSHLNVLLEMDIKIVFDLFFHE